MGREAQPYRKGTPRTPGPALQAMLRGRTLHGTNPMDAKRAGMLTRAAKSRKPRGPRKPRAPRA